MREVKFAVANDQVFIDQMKFGHQVRRYSFFLRRFRMGGEVPVLGYKPIFGRAFGHF